MKTYQPITEGIVEQLKDIVGEKFVWTDEDHLEQYKTDEETDPRKFHHSTGRRQWWHRLPQKKSLPS